MGDVQTDLFGKPTAAIQWKDNEEGKPKRGVQVFYDKERDIYTIVEFRKTGSKQKKEVDGKNIRLLRETIQQELKVGKEADYKSIIRRLSATKGLHKTEGVELETFVSVFNGGIFRAKYYFPMLYFPLKVLAYLNEIEHGQGKIHRLK